MKMIHEQDNPFSNVIRKTPAENLEAKNVMTEIKIQ